MLPLWKFGVFGQLLSDLSDSKVISWPNGMFLKVDSYVPNIQLGIYKNLSILIFLIFPGLWEEPSLSAADACRGRRWSKKVGQIQSQIFKSGIRNLFLWGDPSSNHHDHDHPHQMAGGAGCRAASERCDEAGRRRKGNNPSGARRYYP